MEYHQSFLKSSKILFAVLPLLLAANLLGQSKTVTQTLVKDAVITQLVRRGDAGFIVAGAKSNYHRDGIKITYFDNSLNKKWEHTWEKEQYDNDMFFITDV